MVGQIIYRKQAQSGLNAVKETPDAKVLILDIMMPAPNEELDSETDNGLVTGIWFLEQIRPLILERPLPVIVLTNRILDTIAQRIAKVSIPKRLLEIKCKIETPKFYIPHLVGEMIQNNKPKK